jgi:serine/threonine protein kinase
MDNYQFRNFSKETKDLIVKMLNKNPDRRITSCQALKHKFFVKNGFVK